MVLLEAFNELKQFLAPPKYKIDNFIYVLHYQWTFGLLLGCCILISLKEFFGTPIQCIANTDTKPYSEKFINAYCWIHSTFSIESAWNKNVGAEIPYPGVDKSTPGDRQVYHTYYQWVALVLFIQASSFYIPHLIWKSIESGLVKRLVANLEQFYFDDESERLKYIQRLSKYFLNDKSDPQKSFFYWYIFTEFLNFLNLLLQMFLIDKFLGGLFLNYGFDVISHYQSDWFTQINPMIRVFPRVSKCTFRMFGESGDLEKHDTMCVLSINIVNEKIYIVLWFWFYLLAILTALGLIYRSMIFSLPFLRTYRIKQQLCHENIQYSGVKFVTENLSKAKWFLLNLLLKNIDPINRYGLMKLLEKHQQEKFRQLQKSLSLNNQMKSYDGNCNNGGNHRQSNRESTTSTIMNHFEIMSNKNIDSKNMGTT